MIHNHGYIYPLQISSVMRKKYILFFVGGIKIVSCGVRTSRSAPCSLPDAPYSTWCTLQYFMHSIPCTVHPIYRLLPFHLALAADAGVLNLGLRSGSISHQQPVSALLAPILRRRLHVLRLNIYTVDFQNIPFFTT